MPTVDFKLPDLSSQLRKIVDMQVRGERFKRPQAIHHSPMVNGCTGQPHTKSREAMRNLKRLRSASCD